MLQSLRTPAKTLASLWSRIASFDGLDEEASSVELRYERIFESLDPSELRADSSVLDEEALVRDLWENRPGSGLFLDYYSGEGARMALERYGVFDLLRDRGFEPVLSVDLVRPDDHRVRIHDREPVPERLLIELSAGFRELALPPEPKPARMLFVHWLLMQNPDEEFDRGAQPLPGQDHPGLGFFDQFGYILHLMAKRLGCDGLMNRPSYFHHGVLYGRFLHFVDPELEGRSLALQRDLEGLSLAEASEALRTGRVVDSDGEVASWEAEPQVLPVSQRARSWFESDLYRRRVERARDSRSFRVVA